MSRLDEFLENCEFLLIEAEDAAKLGVPTRQN